MGIGGLPSVPQSDCPGLTWAGSPAIAPTGADPDPEFDSSLRTSPSNRRTRSIATSAGEIGGQVILDLVKPPGHLGAQVGDCLSDLPDDPLFQRVRPGGSLLVVHAVTGQAQLGLSGRLHARSSRRPRSPQGLTVRRPSARSARIRARVACCTGTSAPLSPTRQPKGGMPPRLRDWWRPRRRVRPCAGPGAD